jgi:predicted transcriptional regulator of viral defense system
VFSVKEIAAALDAKIGYGYLVAYRMKKAGVLHEIEKGKYSLESDPFMVASWITWPSYISCLSALHYWGLTEQLPFTIHVVTTRKRKKKSVAFGGAKIEFIHLKKSSFLGFKKVPYHGSEIFIAEKEKAIVDALAARKMSLGAAASLVEKNKGKVSVRKLLLFAKARKGLSGKLRGALYDKQK